MVSSWLTVRRSAVCLSLRGTSHQVFEVGKVHANGGGNRANDRVVLEAQANDPRKRARRSEDIAAQIRVW